MSTGYHVPRRGGAPRNDVGGLFIPRRSPRNHPLRHPLGASIDEDGTPYRRGPATPKADARLAQAAGVSLEQARRMRRVRARR